MTDYSYTSAWTTRPIRLCVSEEEARSIALEVVENCSEPKSVSEDGIELEKTESGYTVFAATDSYSVMRSYEGLLLPFLKRCADPQEQILIGTLCSSGCDCDEEYLILKNGIHADDIVCDAADAFAFVSTLIDNGKIVLDENGLSLTE